MPLFPTFEALMPLLILAVGALFALLGGSFTRRAEVGFVVGGGVLLIAALQLGMVGGVGLVVIENGPALLHITPLSNALSLLLLALAFLCLPLLWHGFAPEQRRSELAVLLLLVVLGAGLLLAANHLLMVYVALELMSFPLYILCAWQREDAKSSEAGLKYFVLGSLASGLMLFGGSLLYAATGALDFASLGLLLANPTPLALVGVILVLAGVAFKLSWVPFHFYTPDVYEGAPTPVTAILAALPKLAVAGLLVQLLVGPFGGAVGAKIAPMMGVLAVASMGLGASLAIVQGNLKRLLAYSTIANMGFVLVPLVALATQPSANAVAGVMFYVWVYGLTSIGLFAALQCQNLTHVNDLKGLAKQNPWLAASMGVLLFSLAGIPPLAGFMSKFMAFMPAVQAGWGGLVLLAVLMSIVASFYSLWLLKLMVFDTPNTVKAVIGDDSLNLVVAVCALVILLLGVYPAALANLCYKVALALF